MTSKLTEEQLQHAEELARQSFLTAMREGRSLGEARLRYQKKLAEVEKSLELYNGMLVK